MPDCKRGFTFVESLIVVAIFAALSAVLIFYKINASQRSKQADVSVQVLAEMNLVLTRMRNDFNNIVIDDDIVDEHGNLHKIDIYHEQCSTNQNSRIMAFYKAIEVDPVLGKTIAGKIEYELQENNSPQSAEPVYSLKRKLMGIGGVIQKQKLYLPRSIKSFKIEMKKFDIETNSFRKVTDSSMSLATKNVPNLILIEIIHREQGQVNGIITVASPYMKDRINEEAGMYYSNWLVPECPNGSAKTIQIVPVPPMAGVVNFSGAGTAISNWR